MKALFSSLLLCSLLWGDFFLIDDGKEVRLMPFEGPKCDQQTLAALPHVTRKVPTLTLLYRGEGYNNSHVNVRTATLEDHPTHTVLDEDSELLDDGSYRITFDNYTFFDRLLLQVYYKGEWSAAVLEPLDQQ